MKRALPLLLVLLAGLAIGYAIGSLGGDPAPVSEKTPERPIEIAQVESPPVVIDQSDEIARLKREIARLKSERAKPVRDPGPDVRLAEKTEDIATGTVRVIVTDSKGEPVADQRLTLKIFKKDGYSTTDHRMVTGSDGTAERRKLAPCRCAVITDIGSAGRVVYARISGGRVTEVRIEIEELVEVTGSIRHHVDGPIPGGKVGIRTTTGKTQTTLAATADDGGQFRFEGAPPGVYLVTVYGKAVGKARTVEQELVVKPPGPCRLDLIIGFPSIVGLVTDEATGRPIPGARVGVQGERNNETTADAGGRFVFHDVKPGTVHLWFAKKGYATGYRQKLQVVAKTTLTVDCALLRGVILRCRVMAPDGQPYIGRITIHYQWEESGRPKGNSASFQTDDVGSGTCDKIPPGEYVMKFRALGIGKAEMKQTLESGETTIDVRLK